MARGYARLLAFLILTVTAPGFAGPATSAPSDPSPLPAQLPIILCGTYVWDHNRRWQQRVEIRLTWMDSDGSRLTGIALWDHVPAIEADVTVEILERAPDRLSIRLTEANPRPQVPRFRLDGSYGGIADPGLDRLAAVWTGSDGLTGRLIARRCAGGDQAEANQLQGPARPDA